jgi:hypothetical protein
VPFKLAKDNLVGSLWRTVRSTHSYRFQNEEGLLDALFRARIKGVSNPVFSIFADHEHKQCYDAPRS